MAVKHQSPGLSQHIVWSIGYDNSIRPHLCHKTGLITSKNNRCSVNTQTTPLFSEKSTSDWIVCCIATLTFFTYVRFIHLSTRQFSDVLHCSPQRVVKPLSPKWRFKSQTSWCTNILWCIIGIVRQWIHVVITAGAILFTNIYFFNSRGKSSTTTSSLT